MQFIVLACLAAVALAAPQVPNPNNDIQIIRDERIDNGDGNFRYDFAAQDNTEITAEGTPGGAGQSNMVGVYRFTFPDGTTAEVNWRADENGYVAESPLIPVAPAHVAELLRIAEEQRAQGITFNEQGFRN